MKTLPKRLENAVTKLYNAFHANELDAYDCSKCAVGNMCNNQDGWANVIGTSDNDIPVLILKHYNGSDKELIDETGYTPYELGIVEIKFIEADCNWDFPKPSKKQLQFNGLCAVVKYLCELDGVENIMEIQSLFEFDENKKPINQLTF